LKNLVIKTAISQGLAKPQNRIGDNTPNSSERKRKQDGLLNAQKLVLTSLVNEENNYHKVRNYVQPEDYSKEQYQTVAKLLYQQLEEGKVNPSGIINHFTDEEDHSEVAALFYGDMEDIESSADKDRALKEAVIKIKSSSLEKRRQEADGNDMKEWQWIAKEKRLLEELMRKEEW